jgi:hypothetical protein
VAEIKRTLVADTLARVKPKRARFAWERRVPLGGPTLFAGSGGIGKSTILAWIIGNLTRGTLPGDLEGKPVTVALIAAEDDLETTLVPRLQVANADLDRVWILNGRAEDGEDSWKEHPTISGHLNELRDKLIELDARVLIVDPVVSMQSGNSKELSDVRRDLDRFSALAKELDLAMIWVHHFNKGQGNVSDRMSGSHAYRDIPRSVLLLAEDGDTGQRILSHDKSNYGALQPSLAFVLETATTEVADGETTEVGRATFHGESQTNVQDIVNREEKTLGQNGFEILELASAQTTVTPADVVDLLGCSASSARTYLARLKKRGDLESQQPGQFAITESGRVAVSRVAVSRSDATSATGATAQQGGGTVTPLFDTCELHGHPTRDGLCARCLEQQQGAV